MKKLILKDEGNDNGQIYGPLYLSVNGKMKNYRNGERCTVGGKMKFFAKWFTLSEAKAIAKSLKIKVEVM